MGLQVIGSGLGRTGTTSLKKALTMLGLGPCQHMLDVLACPERMGLWVDAGAGTADWDAIFEGYRSTVDYPGAVYWRELAARYPDAKVVHSVRDPDEWYDSTQETIFAPDRRAGRTFDNPSLRARFFGSFTGAIHGRLHDRAFMTDYFCRHTEQVTAGLAPERLLVYEVGQGWEPLCGFLGVPVPDQPFPAENARAAWWRPGQASPSSQGESGRSLEMPDRR
jgi:hypothetical protein